MAFQTRCPECNAKLKFDEEPDADEAIECPRCGHVYDAADAKPIPKKPKPAEAAPRKKKVADKSGAPRKRKVKKKKSNPVVLWVMLIGAIVVAPAIGWVGYKLFFSTGKIGTLMGYVPPDCNLLRGCDVERLGKYTGYKSQLDLAMTGPFAECRDELAKAAGVPAETFMDYALSAQVRNGPASGSMFVFQSIAPFSSATLLKALGGKTENVDGQEVQALPAKTGVMSGAYVYCPTERIIVVVASSGDARKMLKASLAAKATPKETSMLAKLGDTGKKASRAHIWTLMRPTGDMKKSLVEPICDPLKASLPQLSQRVAATEMFGTWLYFGSMIKYGVGIECDSETSAQGLVTAMKEGPMGKGEDSEIPRDLRSIFPVIMNKEFSEFLSNLRYNSVGNMAFLDSKMEFKKSQQVLTYFNKPEMWDPKPIKP